MAALRELLRRTERKQARAIDELRRSSRPGHEDPVAAAFFRWWLDLLDDRHAELRIALNVNTGRGSEVLRFAGGARSPFPETAPPASGWHSAGAAGNERGVAVRAGSAP